MNLNSLGFLAGNPATLVVGGSGKEIRRAITCFLLMIRRLLLSKPKKRMILSDRRLKNRLRIMQELLRTGMDCGIKV